MSFSKRSRTIKWFLKILKWTIVIIVVTIASISIWVYTGGIDRMMSKAVGQAYCKMTPGCVFEEYKLINGVYTREKYQNKTEIKEKKEKSVKKEKKSIDKKSEAYKAYLAQESRFALNGCELTYNEQPFYIGMSLEEVRKMFGKETHTYRRDFWEKESQRYFWKDKGLLLLINNSKVQRIKIYLKKISNQKLISNKGKLVKDNIIGNQQIIFDHILLAQTDKIKEYIEKSNLEFDDFSSVHESGYSIDYPCKNDTYQYYLTTEVFKNMVGGGHLYLFDSWDFNNTNEIERISIYSENEEKKHTEEREQRIERYQKERESLEKKGK